MAENLGAIGAVIAHEMTHGFDDKGRLYDHTGAMGNWWTDEDISNFEKRTKVIIEQFDSFKVHNKSVNGALTLGENIADIGGVKLAVSALIRYFNEQDKDPFTKLDNEPYNPMQLFFMSWARVWCAHITEEDALKRLVTDVHSPGSFRVNGVLGNVNEFFRAYNLTKIENVPMRPNKIAEIW